MGEGEKEGEEGGEDLETKEIVIEEVFEALRFYFVWNLTFIWFFGECRRFEKEGKDDEYK